MSGLRAAGLLDAAGFDVTVLEARDRIGGRIEQSSELGPLVDLGASWIHGTEHNPLIHLAEKANSTTVACDAVSSICDPKGKWLSSGKACQYYQEVWEVLDKAESKSRKETASLSDAAKMMDFFRQEIASRRSQVEQPEEYENLMLQIVEMWGAFMGSECETQGLKNLWLDAGLEGGKFVLLLLFLLETLSAELPSR